MNRREIYDSIENERRAQAEKWGTERHDHDMIWLTILTEEIGEAANEILCGGRDARLFELRCELVQIAAVAIAWLEELDESTG